MISVCMATYNGAKYIREQIDSILFQLDSDDELIISDDGSTDATLEIITSYQDTRIRLLHFSQPKVTGIPAHRYVTNNFAHALAQARGEYIFLCDQDDIWLPDKVEKCVQALQQCDLVLHDCLIINENKSVVHSSFFKVACTRKGFWPSFTKMGSHLGCCMVFRRLIFKAVLPFTAVPHDTWICLLTELLFTTSLLPEPLSMYRRHGGNVSNASQRSTLPIWYRIYYRIPILYKVLMRYFKYKLGL